MPALRVQILLLLLQIPQVFEAFTSHAKKQQLGQIEMPIVKERGLTRIMSRYGEFPRFIILVSIVSYLILTINNRDKAEQTLTVKQEGVIEGCCNFMQSPSVIRSSRSTQSFSSAQNIRQQGSSASEGMADDRAEALAGGLCRTASWALSSLMKSNQQPKMWRN